MPHAGILGRGDWRDHSDTRGGTGLEGVSGSPNESSQAEAICAEPGACFTSY